MPGYSFYIPAAPETGLFSILSTETTKPLHATNNGRTGLFCPTAQLSK